MWVLNNFDRLNKNYSVYNVGRSQNNFRIIDLAKKVANRLGNIKIQINKKNNDKRSYNASFEKFNKLTGGKIVSKSLESTIRDLIIMVKRIQMKSKIKKNFIRLEVLEKQIKQNRININLRKKND